MRRKQPQRTVKTIDGPPDATAAAGGIEKILGNVIEQCAALDDEAVACENENTARAEALRDASRAICCAICGGSDSGTDDARVALAARRTGSSPRMYRVVVKTTASLQPRDTYWESRVIYCGPSRDDARAAYHRSCPEDYGSCGNRGRETIMEAIDDSGGDASEDTITEVAP